MAQELPLLKMQHQLGAEIEELTRQLVDKEQLVSSFYTTGANPWDYYSITGSFCLVLFILKILSFCSLIILSCAYFLSYFCSIFPPFLFCSDILDCTVAGSAFFQYLILPT